MPQKRVSTQAGLPAEALLSASKTDLKAHVTCVGCGQSRRLTFHHLIPKKLHRRPHYKRHYSKAELNQGVMMCRPCHAGVHRLFDEMTLAKSLNTAATLLNDPRLQKHFAWVAKLRIKAEGRR